MRSVRARPRARSSSVALRGAGNDPCSCHDGNYHLERRAQITWERTLHLYISLESVDENYVEKLRGGSARVLQL